MFCKSCSKKLGKKNTSGYCRWCRTKFVVIRFKRTEEDKIRMSIRQTGSGNSNWKGDSVKYTGLHAFVKKIFPKPELCMDCKIVAPRDLANRGIYNRDVCNWEWLCRRCHMIKDGRMKNLKHNHATKESILNKN